MENKKALSEEIYQHLLDQIFNGELKPNDKITENSLALNFQTSRTPIREAMRKLESQGLLKIYPNRYAEIASFSKKEINDIGVIRLSLDILAIKLAVIYSTKNDFLRLKEIAENCYLAYENNDGLKRRKLDTRFHEYLCELSKNELLLSMQNDLSLKIQFLLLHNNLPDVEDVEHIKQHIEIANALINGNEKKAIEIDIDHLYEFYNLDVPLDFFK